MHYKILWCRWALVSPDGEVPSHMIGVSASVNLPLYHKVQKFSSDTGSPGWCQKKGRKTVVVVVYITVFKWQRKCNTACAQIRLTFPVHPSKVLTIKSFHATVNLISNKKKQRNQTPTSRWHIAYAFGRKKHRACLRTNAAWGPPSVSTAAEMSWEVRSTQLVAAVETETHWHRRLKCQQQRQPV